MLSGGEEWVAHQQMVKKRGGDRRAGFILIDQSRALRKDRSADSRLELPAAVDGNQSNERGGGTLFNDKLLNCNAFQK